MSKYDSMFDAIQNNNYQTTKKKKKSYEEQFDDIQNNSYEMIAPIKSNQQQEEEKFSIGNEILKRLPGYSQYYYGKKAIEKIKGINPEDIVNTSQFDDGYQFGDVTKTTAGTILNGATAFTKGVMGIGDSAAKLVAGGAAQVFDWAGNEEFANALRKAISDKSPEAVANKRKYTPYGWVEQLNENTDDYSILGEAPQQALEGAGYYAGMTALQEVGVPWYLTAAASSMGNELGEAYSHDAEDWEAWASAINSAAWEVVSEKLAGGVKLPGTGKTTEALFGSAVDQIKNKTLKALVGFGINMAGEGAEEVISGITSEMGRRLTYMRDDEKSLIENALNGATDYMSQQALDDFIMGAVVSGITMGVNPQTYRNAKSGRNLVTGYTSNEQRVLDKVTDDRIAEAQKNSNKPLTKKQLNQISSEVKADFESGNIGTKNIENVLGYGEVYLQLKSQTEDSIGRELTPEEDRAVLQEATEIYNESIKDDAIIQQNYYEDSLRSQVFEANLEDYDEDLRETIQKAIDSGILNNSTKTHQFVEFLSNLARDKGVTFDFTNNEALANSGIGINGAQVNGYVNANGDITLNIESGKSLNSVVGHELTHVLEGSDLYKALSDSIKEYATTIGEYQDRYDKLAELYKDVKNANIEKELTADLVGDYLFTNQEFINHLTQNRNLFEKIYDEIKYLVKQALPGSKEEKQLRKVQKMFEQAYKDNSVKLAEQQNATNDKKFALAYVDKARLSKSELARLNEAAQLKQEGATDEEIWQQTQVIMGDTLANSKVDIPDLKFKDKDIVKKVLKMNTDVKLSDVMEGDLFKNYPQFKDIKIGVYNFEQEAIDGNLSPEKIKIYKDTDGAVMTDGSITINSTLKTLDDVEGVIAHEIQHKIQEESGLSENTSDILLKKGVKEYKLRPVELEAEVTRVMRKLTSKQREKINPQSVEEEIKKYYEEHNYGKLNVDTVINRLINKHGLQFSLSTDSNGRELTEQQQEYFKDSKVRDENGNLITVYHTTTDEVPQFNEFNPIGTPGYRYGEQVVNFYTNSKTMSGSYADYDYEMADTKTLKTIDDINDILKNENNKYIKEYKLEKNNTNEKPDYEYVVKNRDSNILFFKNKEDLLKNFKKSFGDYNRYFKINSDVTNKKAKYQYEGYVNITNPYIVDAEEMNWDEIVDSYDEMSVRYANEIKEEDKQALIDLVEDSKERYKEINNRLYQIKNEVYDGRNEKYHTIRGIEDIDSFREDVLRQLKGKYKEKISRLLDEYESLRNTPHFEDDYFRANVSELQDKINDYLNMGYSDFDLYKMADSNFDKTALKHIFGQKSSTNDIVKKVLNQNKNGANYDGVIIKNVLDYGSTSEFDDLGAAQDVYVTFNSNQFKASDNTTPTEDADIRYSLSSTGEMVDNATGEKVELDASDTGNTGTLMAIHNLNADKLNGVLDLGGFPYPSIAITKPSEISHEGYGDISVLFNKDTINPELNSKNKVFSRDAYTPRFPKVEYKLNSDVIKQLRNTIGDYDYRNMQPGDKYISDARSIIDNLDDSINNRGGLERTLNNIKDSDAMKYIYLKQTNPSFKVETKDEQYSSKFNNETLQRFIDNFDGEYDYNNIESSEVDNYTNQILDAYRQQLIEEYNNSDIDKETAQKLIDVRLNGVKERFAEKDNFLLAAHKLNKYGKENQVLDTVATKEKINNTINQNEYEKWVDNQFKDIIEKKGLRNNKDYYTNTGNPRSFEQLHDEYTLDNVVKIMDALNDTGEEGGFFYGINEIAGNASQRFNTISDIKANENLLETIGDEQYSQMLEDISNRLSTIEDAIMERGHNNSDNYFIARDNLGSAIGETARDYGDGKKVNANKIVKELNEYGFNITTEEAQQILDMFQEMRNLPTTYFEAKPQRAVGLNEIQQVVIPSNSSQELRDRLQELGIPFTEYNPEVEGDRNRVINQFDDLKFSMSKQNEDIAPIGNYNVYGSDIALQDELAPIQDEFIKKDILDLIHQEVARKGGKKVELVKPVIAKEKTPARTTFDTLKEAIVNENVELDNMAKESGNKMIKIAGDMLNNAYSEAQYDITAAQTDNYGNAIGKSVQQLFEDAKKEGLEAAFNDYLINYSNIDRWARGKGSQTPLDVSERLVANYEEKYPQFKEWAQDVWKFAENVRNNWLEAGMISQNMYKVLSEAYPHYVPYISDTNNFDATMDKMTELKARPIKKAKGGAAELFPVEEALTRYTYAQKKAYRQNELYKQIYNTLQTNPGQRGAEVGEDYFNGTEPNLYRDDSGNYLTAVIDGEERKVQISDDLYKSLSHTFNNQVKDLENRLSTVLKPLQWTSNIRRKLLTTWNPVFLVKNVVKDLQDGVLNSKHTTGMLKNYAPGIVELFTNSTPEAKQFKALYGTDALRGQYEEDLYKPKEGNKNNGFLKGLVNANEIMELAPRYAEFKASLQAGESLEEAMYNAREVTTNFARGGVITKALNRNGFTFLNASVQGFDKFIRNFSGENGARGIANSLLKAAIFAVAPAVFNELAFGAGDDKDEDYDALPDYIKDNYYLIKMGDGTFVRIPKGRMLSVFGSAARRTIELAEGEEDAFEGYLSNVNNQIGVSNPEENNVFSPLIQAFGSENGTSWYGGDIVPTRLQDKPAAEQYDASTDKMSIWLGEHTGISPYKLNYVLDQYSGGIGDIVLPMITDEATSNGNVLAPVVDQFVVDSTTDNKYVSDFYSKNDELKVKANSSKATDDDLLRNQFSYEISKELGQLYAERREIQSNNSLTKAQKYEKSQAIKKQINEIAKFGLDNTDNISRTGNYADVGDRAYYKNAKGKWTAADQKDIIATESMGLTNREKDAYYTVKNEMYNIDQTYDAKLKGASDEQKTQLNAQKKVDIINSIKNTNLPDNAKATLYDKKYGSTETLNAVIDCKIDFDSYLDLQAQNFTADKDINGKTINGSKKRKIYSYINQLDMPYEQKIMLAKLEYKSDDTYNREIINYLNNDKSINYQTMVEILEAMGFKIDSNGNISWE